MNESYNWSPKGSNGWGPLHLAAATGDMKRLVVLLDSLNQVESDIAIQQPRRQSHFDSRTRKLEQESSSGDRPFHVALRNGQVVAARELIRAGCNAFSRGRGGETAAHICAIMDLERELELLMNSKKIDITMKTLEFEETIVHLAAKHGRVNFLGWMASKSLLTIDLFMEKNNQGLNCLHLSAKGGHAGTVEWILSLIDSINSQYLQTIQKLLVQEGEKVHIDLWEYFYHRSNGGKDPCQFAKLEGNLEVVQILESYRDSKLSKRNELKRFFQHIKEDKIKSIKAAIKRHGKWLVTQPHWVTGSCSVLEAARYDRSSILKVLLEYVNDLQSVSNVLNGDTILHICAREGAKNVLAFVVEKLNNEITNKNGDTPLVVANLLKLGPELLEKLDNKVESKAIIEEESGDLGLLSSWLQKLSLDAFYSKLVDNGFDSLERMAFLNKSDMASWGMKTGHQRHLLRCIADLKQEKLLEEGKEYLFESFAMKRSGDLIECSCLEWCSQSLFSRSSRTCVHLKKCLGELAELRRIDFKRTRELYMNHIQSELQSHFVKLELKSSMTSTKSSEGSADSILPAHQVLLYEEFTFGEVIGGGSFGVVRAAEWRGMLVAVKQLRTAEQLNLSEQSCDSGSEKWDLKHEAGMMSRVSNHENIVPFIGVLLAPRACVVTKLMRQGSLEDLLVNYGALNRRSSFSFIKLVQMAIDAAAGVLHLHSSGVIHRDIAARNLLVDENYRVRVADFGFARIKEMNRSKGYTSQHIGPIKWMAPEAMRFKCFSEMSDVYSFGITLIEILAGRSPWPDVDNLDVVFRVCNGERLSLPDEFDESLRNMVHQCQSMDVTARLSMQNVYAALITHRDTLNIDLDEKPLVPNLIRQQNYHPF